MVSPLVINIMLACHCSGNPAGMFEPQAWESVATKDARKWLMNNDLINDRLEPTERGRAWIAAICSTPLPVQTWVIPPMSAATDERVS